MKIDYRKLIWQIITILVLILLIIIIKNWDGFVNGFNAG